MLLDPAARLEPGVEQFLDEYLDAAGIRDGGKTPLFRSARGKSGMLTDRPMHRVDAYEMVRRPQPRPASKESSVAMVRPSR